MVNQTRDLVVRQNGPSAIESMRDAGGPGFALTFAEMRARVEGLNEFYRGVMQEGTDYGKIPGTDKPTLLQPGAQLLDGIFGLAPTFEEMPSCVRDYDRGFFSFDIRCRLVDKRTGDTAADCVGHCNSKEDRYRWRSAKRVCPECGAEAIIKGKPEFGGGWLCYRRLDGCGAKFAAGDAAIVTQPEGRVENDDTYSLVNTILKMAQKRAHVGATLNATGASRIFTQDVEDLPEFQQAERPPAADRRPQPERQPATERERQPRGRSTDETPGAPAGPDSSGAPSPERDSQPAPANTAESIEQAFEAEPAGNDREPPWARTPLGRQVMALADALTDAGKKYALPGNDADNATLEGWIASKKTLLPAARK